jgi:hypothetical protein
MELGVRIPVRHRLPVVGAPGAETAGVGRERESEQRVRRIAR